MQSFVTQNAKGFRPKAFHPQKSYVGRRLKLFVEASQQLDQGLAKKDRM
jgi:hypothetical protein